MIRFDNTELGENISQEVLESAKKEEKFPAEKRRQMFNNDKIHTSTLCRFEANALYGISNVLVVDFDEFL